MDLASSLCHYRTVGLPPEKLFSIHSNWMPWLEPSITDWGETSCCSGALQCLWSGLHQCSWVWGTGQLNGRQAAGYLLCGKPFIRAWRVGWSYSVFDPGEAVLYIMTPYNISAYFIGQQETAVLPEWDNPCILHTDTHIHTQGHQKYSQAFYSRDISSSVFFCFVTAQFLGL